MASRIRMMARDICLIGCAEFLPFLRIGLGVGFTVKLAVALIVKLQLLALLPSSAEYLHLQSWAMIAIGLHLVGRFLNPWLRMLHTDLPAGSEGVFWLAPLLPRVLCVLLEPLAVLAFAWHTASSVVMPGFPPPLGWEITGWMLGLGLEQWAGNATLAHALPVVAAGALPLLHGLEGSGQGKPQAVAADKPLTFSLVRLSKPRARLPVPSALGMALDLQREPERKTA